MYGLFIVYRLDLGRKESVAGDSNVLNLSAQDESDVMTDKTITVVESTKRQQHQQLVLNKGSSEKNLYPGGLTIGCTMCMKICLISPVKRIKKFIKMLSAGTLTHLFLE